MIQISQLNNVLGFLANSPTIQIFGPRPSIGSFFSVSFNSSAIHEKRRLQLSLHWIDLPQNFARYFKGYDLGESLSNNSFLVDFYLVYAGEDKLLNSSPLSLFREKEKYRLADESRFEFNLEGLTHIETGIMQLKMVFVHPQYGFGHDAFPTALLTASMRNEKGDTVKLPQVPFSPCVSKVELEAWS